MTKMEMIERFYGRNEELERTIAAAEKAGEAAALAACQDHCDHFFCHKISPLKISAECRF